MTRAEERNARVLGRGVHPAALRRLHELFPSAHVTVQHVATERELPHGEMRFGRRYYRNPERKTAVYIDLDGEAGLGGTICGTAICHPEDNFDRRRGVELAFRRALNIARSARKS